MTGHHTGPGVSEFFGDSITSYYWAYVIAEDRIAILFTLPGSASLAGLWVVVFGGKAGRRARACIRSGAWPPLPRCPAMTVGPEMRAVTSVRGLALLRSARWAGGHAVLVGTG